MNNVDTVDIRHPVPVITAGYDGYVVLHYYRMVRNIRLPSENGYLCRFTDDNGVFIGYYPAGINGASWEEYHG